MMYPYRPNLKTLALSCISNEDRTLSRLWLIACVWTILEMKYGQYTKYIIVENRGKANVKCIHSPRNMFGQACYLLLPQAGLYVVVPFLNMSMFTLAAIVAFSDTYKGYR